VFTFALCVTFIGRTTFTPVNAQEISPDGQTITFWHPYTDERQIALEALIEEFNATNEWGIIVEIASFQNTGLLYDQMILQLININNFGGNRDGLPNMVIGFPHEIALYALTEETIVDLNQFMHSPLWGFSETDNNDFVPFIMNIGYDPFNQVQLGLPTRLFTESMVVNMDALRELGYDVPPSNHSELIDMACAFREAGGWSDGKFGIAQGFQLPLEAEFLIGMNAANGGTFFEENPAPSFAFNIPPLQGTLSMFVELQDRNCIGTVQSSIDAVDSFAAGQTLFYFGSTATLSLLRDHIAQNYAVPFEWSVFPLPGEQAETAYVFGPIMSVVNHSPESNLAAWQFLKWFLSTDIHSTWIEATGNLPIRQSSSDTFVNSFATFPQWHQAQALVNQSILTTLPALAGYDVIRLEIQFVLQRILATTKTITNELSALDQLSNKILVEFAHSDVDD
jgi:multiple sugar transport system substrate-binding protein/sn-glycerol 3-phosphate transport system substrate-binding protein